MPTAISIPQEYSTILKTKDELYPGVFFVQVESAELLPFTPGQYASFLIGDKRRPFSFANQEGSNLNDFLIVTKPQGLTESYLKQTNLGDTIKLLAPYGRFTINTTDTRPILFIAGGTGIAPIRSHIQQIMALKLSNPVTLYFAHYDADRLFFQSEFADIAATNPNFSYIPVLSEPKGEWPGKRGLVTEVVPQDIPNLKDYTIYVCGSPAMVTDTLAMLAKHNVPPDQINFERFT